LNESIVKLKFYKFIKIEMIIKLIKFLKILELRTILEKEYLGKICLINN